MKKQKTKNRKEKNKFEIALMLTILGSIAFFFIYKYVMVFYFTKRYDDVLLAYNSNYYSIIFFCGFLIIGISNYFSKERKMKPKKYWTIFSCIGTAIFLLVSYFTTQAWVVTKQDISYNTIFTEKTVSYSYQDFDTIQLYYNNSTGIKGRGVSPEYKIKTKDGETIVLCLFESYYTSYENLIEFDKLIEDKRVCTGEYNSLHIPEELNQYYKTIFQS